MKISKKVVNNIEIIIGENDRLRYEIAPAIGGRILSIYNKELQKEFLWNNKDLSLSTHVSGEDYDSHFWGGIDELIPNDIPENIDAIDYPDHGELWTTPLSYDIDGCEIVVYGELPLSNLYYEKKITLDVHEPIIHLRYNIRNGSNERRHFLWKLHAALNIEEGDTLVTSARKGKVVYPGLSRVNALQEFAWPYQGSIEPALVPPQNNTMDFLYLYDIQHPEMGLISGQGRHLFSYQYEQKIFPYEWYFASYGGFHGHYTAILEPSTNMPVSVNEAKAMNQSAILEPGQEINTTVNIYAGETK